MSPEQQQPPHCNGRQWMKPSFSASPPPPPSTPPRSHFGCRHRRCDSDRFAWNEPFRSARRGGERRAEDAGRPSTTAAAAAVSSSHPAALSAILPLKQTVGDDCGEGEKTHSPSETCRRPPRRNGCDCSNCFTSINNKPDDKK